MPGSTSPLTMPSSYFQLILREWATTPELDASLREGLSEQGPGVIDVRRQMRQLQTMNRLLPPGWGLRLGSLFDSSTHGQVGLAVASANTLGQALEVIGTYGHLQIPFIRFAWRREGKRALLQFLNTDALGDAESLPLHEATMVGVQTLLRRIVGSFEGALVEFDRPRPHYSALYADYLQGEVCFGRATTALSFDRSWMNRRSVLADEDLFRSAISRLRLSMRALDEEDPLVGRVRQLVAVESVGVPSLRMVCVNLGVSGRTLVRKLNASGTSYREIIDARRRARAERLLYDDSITISELSYMLGYSDTANFGRSCRRWFGASPAAYRRQMLDLSLKASEINRASNEATSAL